MSPVRRSQAAYVVDPSTGEVIGWRGLNEDPDDCPGYLCGECGPRCVCAPCRCPECVERAESARRLPPENRPLVVTAPLTLFAA